MAINVKKLLATQFVPSTFTMPLPAVAGFVDSDTQETLAKLTETIAIHESSFRDLQSKIESPYCDADSKAEHQAFANDLKATISGLLKEKQTLETNATSWTVRGMTACEIAQVNESVDKNRNIDLVATALTSNADKQETIKEMLGVLVDDTPIDFMRRISRLVICSVDPVIDTATAIKFSEAYPIEFQLLTTKILELTGQGMDVKKS